jgi:uncharacterized protein (DUF697 family)/GTP-binding protein EngB required for normal cell division
MEKGNVLVMGYSGVGRSTLIKTVLGEESMKKKTQPSSASKDPDFQVYENPGISFRLVDTIGLEPGIFKELKTVNAVKKWSGENIKKSKAGNYINVIWFCVDRYTAKLFPKTMASFMNAISVWKNVPIVVVITQAYDDEDTEETKKLIEDCFLSKKKYCTRLTAVVSVVAKPRTTDGGEILPPKGITELIELTNDLLPEGSRAAQKDIAKYNLSRKRAMSQAVISLATIAGITVGGVASPVADIMILKPTESLEIESIFKIWGIRKTKKAKELIKSIVELGTLGTTAKMLASSLKLIPGINIGGAVINAFIAGTIVFGIGEASSYIFEQIYTGKKTVSDLDWVKEVMTEKLSNTAVDKVASSIKGMADSDDTDSDQMLDIVLKAFSKKAYAK